MTNKPFTSYPPRSTKKSSKDSNIPVFN